MEESIIEQINELVKSRRIAQLRELLESVNSADFPSLFEKLDDEDMVVIFRLLTKDKASDVFVELDPDQQEKLINNFKMGDILHSFFVFKKLTKPLRFVSFNNWSR